MFTKEQQLSKKKKPRKKKCKNCNDWFTPEREMQTTCGIPCAIAYANKDNVKQKEINKQKREFRQSDKTILKEKVQKLANKYGRLREFSRGNVFCVTCGAKNVKFDGGHFLPTSTYPSIRYYTLQINPQCVNCNQYNGGKPKEYREYMIKRFGLKKVEDLEAQHRVSRKYTVEYYQKYLRVMSKRLKKYNSI